MNDWIPFLLCKPETLTKKNHSYHLGAWHFEFWEVIDCVTSSEESALAERQEVRVSDSAPLDIGVVQQIFSRSSITSLDLYDAPIIPVYPSGVKKGYLQFEKLPHNFKAGRSQWRGGGVHGHKQLVLKHLLVGVLNSI